MPDLGGLEAADRPEEVRLAQGKTGAIGWLKLAADLTKTPRKEAQIARLLPELEDYLDQLARVGDAVVLMTRERHGRDRTWRQFKPPRPYRMAHAQRLVREARVNAGLGEHVTLAACRHGGMTELGDAGLTEQAVMALSQHATPEASRLYVKRTEAQRSAAALQRRQYVERRP
jgi:hypothetical protein